MHYRTKKNLPRGVSESAKIQTQTIDYFTWFHKNGCISTNNGPILKIQNLACSVHQCRSSWRQNDVACDVTRARTSRTQERGYKRHKSQQSLNLSLVAIPVAMGLSRKPWGGFSWFFCMHICVDEPSTYSKNHYHQANNCGFRRFFYYHGNRFVFSPIFITRRRSGAKQGSTHQISSGSVKKPRQS